MKRLVILGATGSIGTQALSCLEECELVGISFYKNTNKLQEIKSQFNHLEVYSDYDTKFNTVNSYLELIEKCKPDLVLNCVVGFSGLFLSKLVIENNINLALANKESLVIGGWLLIDLLKQHPNVKLYPVDSEHSSLYQLSQIDKENLKSIYITCSGGPFYLLSKEERDTKTFKEAIKHPKWNMGYKISVDSATLINKCFELIEAYYLFNMKTIKALYHPQAVVHSLVEFKDHSVFANMSTADMKIAIDLALHDFHKQVPKIAPLSFKNLNLSFNEIDPNQFLAIKWAYEVINEDKKNYGVIINTVNDFVIELFKDEVIKFKDIYLIIQEYLNKYQNYKVETWDDLFNLHEIINADLKKQFFK